ncbi:hypothetical protein [Fructobacillus cardui]|uniref:hypothetical protein n=1 Tax=Fructobacillus cardui TaxID=2893170 RepID=UPI002D944380|nr:unnamed protein product [Fructobacillus cardui]
MSVKAVGYYSREVYMVGKSKEEVLRKLQSEYPSFGSSNIYPEALWLEEEEECD